MKKILFILFFSSGCTLFRDTPEHFIATNKEDFDTIVYHINARTDINDSISWGLGIPEHEISNLRLGKFKEYEPYIVHATRPDGSRYVMSVCLYANNMHHDSCYGVWTVMHLCRCVSGVTSGDTSVIGNRTYISIDKLWYLYISHGI